MQCTAASNHSAWLVELHGETTWEFTPRGRTYLKGTIVEAQPAASKKGKEDKKEKTDKKAKEDERSLAELLDDPSKVTKKTEAGISRIAIKKVRRTRF